MKRKSIAGKTKSIAGLLMFALPMLAAAAPMRNEVKIPSQVTEFPDCADGMDPGTLCKYVPLNAVTFKIPNVQPDLPPLPLKIVMPAGLRSINAEIKLEVSPSTVCDPAPSDVYDGIGGLTIGCGDGQ